MFLTSNVCETCELNSLKSWAATVCRNNERQVSETDEVSFALRISIRCVTDVVMSTLILDVLSTGSMFVGGTRSDFGEIILGNVLFSSLAN
jgi:hypothetical protein